MISNSFEEINKKEELIDYEIVIIGAGYFYLLETF